MKILIVSLLAVLVLTGCESMGLRQNLTVKNPDGSKTHYLIARYGGTLGTKDMAMGALTRYSNALCKSGYDVVEEQVEKGPLSPYGTRLYAVTDVTWAVKCKERKQPIES